MNFYIHKIVIWLKNGSKREVEFKNNKVNIITGSSNTGKTAILDILDYCFFASESNISESVINESSVWYGVKVGINDKDFTLARKAPNRNKVSNEYYYSPKGYIPEEVTETVPGAWVKKIFESEFSIDGSAKISYGNRFIKSNSKISLRYFLLFNTLSGNIIENDEDVFFDKMTQDRYRNALPRIFDLAVGIETIENILKKEKIEDIERKISRLVKKKEKLNDGEDSFRKERLELIGEAKGFLLIPQDLNEEDAWGKIKHYDFEAELSSESGTVREKLERDYFDSVRKLKKLREFDLEYDRYKNSLKDLSDELKPVTYLLNSDKDLVKTSIFSEILDSFKYDIGQIKKQRVGKTPISIQVSDEIKSLESKVEELGLELLAYPKDSSSFQNMKDKYFFLGKLHEKLGLFEENNESVDYSDKIDFLEKQRSEIEVEDTTERKSLTIRTIEEIIEDYIEFVGSALENYRGYLPAFNYSNKSLHLRRPKSTHTENIGSSSNHMFLHLFFSLAMHEIAFNNRSPFIAPFLIIDQPSRPYYGEENNDEKFKDQSDEAKITKAIALLDKFIADRIQNNGSFQFIVLEHIPRRIFEKMSNVHLVEEFRNGNALIPTLNVRVDNSN
ncbi:DUF3732 domain-containing protein [Vibrio nigripulchritudo]|uniref:DUF3732 domain-containing protein n=1 Tax=Vibrio nigripulchritudo TaxID=28173 RepID=UPI0024937D0A|nr:DUF3732 domain-containing protein [Vibrio nigripulchritudo]BDU36700.1 hypothetical protein TUMSATVNIG2_11690 [Vibrio nigripulchritudo]